MPEINNSNGRMWIKTTHGEAELLYRLEGNIMVVYRTFTPQEDRGHGIAAAMAEEAFAFAKKNGLKIRPECSYMLDFSGKHKEYSDLITR